MAGITDANLVIGADLRPAEAAALDFGRRLESKPIRLRFDANNLGSITGKVSEFERSLAAANTRVIAFGASAGQVYLMSRALDSLVTSTIEVQKELANINVILNLSSNGISKFSSDLFNVAKLTGQSFKEVADVALQFSRQGLGAAEVLKRTADAMTLVRIGGTDTDTAVKALTATLNTFNEVGLDSSAILNKIATVDTKFSVSGNVIAEALTRVASTAKDAGVSFDSLIGITTALQQITSRGGSVIGNSLKSIFQRIQRPEVIDQLNQMGVATEDLNGNLLSADVILKNLSKSYGTLSQAQQQQITQLAAGLFQANQFKAIIGDLAKENGIATRATLTSSSATDQAARRQAELNKTLATQFNEVVLNLQKSAANIGNISIAPALQNLFKGVNFLSSNAVGDNLGQGILKGLGNYLSGPGLALAGVLVTKLFTSFATQAASSFARILEVGSSRIQNERVIQDLLDKEPGSYAKIAAAGNDIIKVQTIINELLERQNALINTRATATSAVAGLSGGSLAGIALSNKPFSIGGERLTKNAPGFSSLSTALSEAISKEKSMGISTASIKIGTSNQLISPDNPFGIGVYNTKDEPLGLNQGIDRVARSGGDPKKAGDIPSFADFNQGNNPFPFLPNRFLPPVPSFDIKSLVPDSVKIGDVAKNTKEFEDALYRLSRQLRDTIDSTTKLLPPPQKYFPTGQEGTGPILGPTRDDLNRGKLYNYRGGTGIDLRQSAIGQIDLSILNSKKQYDELSQQYNQRLAQRTKDFNNNLGGLNLLNAPAKYLGLRSESQALGLQGDFRNRDQALRGQALGASFILPLLGGIAQQGIQKTLGTDTVGARGASASVGALANIGAYTATGFGVGGPVGAGIGLGIGLLTELSPAIKAFSDTLPDLLKHINDLKDSANTTSDAFRGYINASEQLSDVNAGNQPQVTAGQKKNLINQQTAFFNQLPLDAQNKIKLALQRNKPEDVYDISSSSDTINQQTINALQDVASLRGRKDSDFPPVPFTTTNKDDINKRLVSAASKVQFNPATGKFTGSSGSDFNTKTGVFTSGDAGENTNPKLKSIADNILERQNSDSLTLQQILEKSSANDLKGLNTTTLPDFLKKNNFTDEGSAAINSETSQLGRFSGGQEYFNSLLKPQSINNRLEDSKLLDNANEAKARTLNDLNVRLAELTITGTKAVSDFEINVITKLSQSLTELRKQNITDETANRIAEIRSGNNDYNKTYFDYTKSNIQARNVNESENAKANTNFSNEIGKNLLGLFDNFTKGLQGTGKNKSSDLTALVNNKSLNLNSVLGDSFNVDTNGVASLKKTDFSKEDVDKIINNLASKNKELDTYYQTVPAGELTNAKDIFKNSAVSSISGISSKDFDPTISFRESIPNIIKANQELLQKLTEHSADLTKGLTEAKNNLDSAYQINYKQLIDNYKILGEEFTKNQSDSLSSSTINRQFSGRAFDLSKQASTSNQFNATVLNSQAKLQPQISSIINELNKSGGFSFGANTTQGDIQNELKKQTLSANVQAQFGGGVTSDTQGKVQALTTATNEYSKALADNKQELDQVISKLTPFTDRLSAFAKEQNINKSENGFGAGGVTGKDFANAAFAPLAYNQQTFAKDSVVGLQDFSQTLKDDLTTSLHQVTAGAQNAGQAFKDLGLSLATNLADKVSSIGISSLLGLGTQALGFGSQNTKSYGFAQGGFVGMGSGTRDDVPAFLSGGEFVINRNAVSKIGRSNLDALNDVPHMADGGLTLSGQGSKIFPSDSALALNASPGVLNDSITGSASSVNATLSNAFLLSSNIGGIGASVTSPLLSNIGLTDANDPQNKIRLSREQFAFGRNQAYQQYQKQLSAYNLQQYIGLGQGFLGGIGSIAGAALTSKGDASSSDAYTQFEGGQGGDNSGYGGNVNDAITAPIGGYGLNADQYAGTQSFYNNGFSGSTSGPSSSSSFFSPIFNTASKIGGSILRASGGYIPKLASGGYFGGDSSSDKFSAMVMGGEYVVSPQTVSKYGKNYFEGLNNAGKYAAGGSVGVQSYGSDSSSTQIINTLTQIRDKLGTTPGTTTGASPNAGAQGSSSGQTNNVTINFSLNSSDGSTSENAASSSSNPQANPSNNSTVSSTDKDNISKFSAQIKNIVIQNITQESRPGGLLYSTFAKKTT